MNWRAKDWIEHSAFGVGRISQDRGDRLDIDFVNQGKKTILKSTELKAVVPPSTDFKFPRDKGISAVVTTYRTITLEIAGHAIKAYNDGTYGCLKNPDLDRQALDMFVDGLGSTSGKIGRQVEFIGRDYGGVTGEIVESALKLSPDIARDIFANRTLYEQAATQAQPILQQIASRSSIDILFSPFVKALVWRGKTYKNWLVWGTKFWHFLNPDAFPIADSRVRKFFELYSQTKNPIEMYMELLKRFRQFALSHQAWLPHLRQVDGGLAWCDNKLWDKMCYGIGELPK